MQSNDVYGRHAMTNNVPSRKPYRQSLQRNMPTRNLVLLFHKHVQYVSYYIANTYIYVECDNHLLQSYDNKIFLEIINVIFLQFLCSSLYNV